MDCELIVNTFSCLDQITWVGFLSFFPFVLLFGFLSYAIYKMSKL